MLHIPHNNGNTANHLTVLLQAHNTRSNNNNNNINNNSYHPHTPSLPPADNRHVSTALDLYVHGAHLAPRNRLFINLWRPNAENVEVTIFMAMYSLQDANNAAGDHFFFVSSVVRTCVRAH